MVECKYCGQKFDSEQGLNTHIGMKHSEKSKNVECDYCGKKFHKNPSQIKNHNFCSQKCYRKYKGYTSWNKDKIVRELKKIANKLGHSPTNKELRKINSALARICREYFGSFNKAKKAAGLEIYHKQWDKEKVLEELKKVANKLKYSPKQKELENMDKYDLIGAATRYFKNFTEAKKAAGLKIYQKQWSKERVKKELKKVSQKIGRSPTQSDLRKLGRHDLVGVCHRYFGSFSSAKEKAGLELYPKPNRPERRVKKICKKFDLPFRYIGNRQKFIGDLNPDFIHNNGSKKVIEIFSIYHKPSESPYDVAWHQTEFGRKAYFSQFGYETLILWTSEMKEMSDEEIKRKIKTFNKK